jgi:hypothetical protein
MDSWTIQEVRSCEPVDGEVDSYRLDITVVSPQGEVIDSDSYMSRSGDIFGANPIIREWIKANK